MEGIINNTSLSKADAKLVAEICAFTKQYFQNPKFDASHDFDHVLRVTNTAISIFEQENSRRIASSLAEFNLLTVILGALLHDVEDKKYTDSSIAANPEILNALTSRGLDAGYADTIYTLVKGVSYSSEVKNPQLVVDVIEKIPELAIVQDADRLDAIGAIGIGRCFTFGGSQRSRSLGDSIQHFEDKLVKLEGMMKTETGRRLAQKRTQRIREFMSWWTDENGPVIS